LKPSLENGGQHKGTIFGLTENLLERDFLGDFCMVSAAMRVDFYYLVE
jgi:hypothetical protein